MRRHSFRHVVSNHDRSRSGARIRSACSMHRTQVVWIASATSASLRRWRRATAVSAPAARILSTVPSGRHARGPACRSLPPICWRTRTTFSTTWTRRCPRARTHDDHPRRCGCSTDQQTLRATVDDLDKEVEREVRGLRRLLGLDPPTERSVLHRWLRRAQPARATVTPAVTHAMRADGATACTPRWPPVSPIARAAPCGTRLPGRDAAVDPSAAVRAAGVSRPLR